MAPEKQAALAAFLIGTLVIAATVAGAASAESPAGGVVAAAAPSETDPNSIAYRMQRHVPLSPAAQVGRQMFFDPSLSGSGKLACSTCHDPQHAYGPTNGLAVQRGGLKLTAAGTRAVPSLRYKEDIPPYADLLDNPDGVSVPGPGGGFTQDGRAPTLADQAKIPLLAANEMANPSGASVVDKIARSAYADLFRQAFGAEVFADPQAAFEQATQALQAFQMEDNSFHPYSSKYDLFAGNKIGGSFTPEEKRGLAVFVNPRKGNCVACHYSGPGLNGSIAMFTDYSYAAIGVPRNPQIPANRERRYFDLGICARDDHPRKANARYCGMFKTPTLRNVATRSVFFHNGKFKSLHDVIRFYNTRDTSPELWYPVEHGVARKYDDLPEAYRVNIDKQGPLDGRAVGSRPPMTEQDMDDLEAFLRTLTDDYRPPLQAQQPASADPTERDHTLLRRALVQYLERQGQLCIGKFDWPVEVSEADFSRRTRDAVQMPVLEKLGLVSSSDETVERISDDVPERVAIKRYQLTDAGMKFYVDKEAITSRGGTLVEHHKDLCGAKLSLDEVVEWSKPTDTPGSQATLSYTFHAVPADWMRDPQAQGVFPMLDRVIKGDGAMRLEQRMQFAGGVWTAAAFVP